MRSMWGHTRSTDRRWSCTRKPGRFGFAPVASTCRCDPSEPTGLHALRPTAKSQSRWCLQKEMTADSAIYTLNPVPSAEASRALWTTRESELGQGRVAYLDHLAG